MKRIVDRQDGSIRTTTTESYSTGDDTGRHMVGILLFLIALALLIFGFVMITEWLEAAVSLDGAVSYLTAHIQARPFQYGAGALLTGIVFGALGIRLIYVTSKDIP